jgi:type I restriction enzyme S subunit
MKKYQSYKLSEFEWVDKVPNHWNFIPFNFVLSESKVKLENINEDLNLLSLSGEKGISNKKIEDEVQVRTSEELSKYNVVRVGQIVMNPLVNPLKLDYFGFSLSNIQGVVSPVYMVFDTNQSTKYIEWYFKSHLTIQYLLSNTKGIRPLSLQLSRETLKVIKILVPPISEQQQIVEFLDSKTELIDKLISTKERKIILLKEQRTSLINCVVTKGLNPNVKMKDNGVEWIGDIPEYWKISKFKYDSSIPVKYGLNISGDKYLDEGIRFIRITDLTEEGDLILDDGKYLDENDVPNEFLLNKWDVLFCRSGHTVGKSYLHKEDGKFTSGGYLVRFNFRNYYESKFIFYISKTSFYWDWIKLNSVVSTIENVNGDKYQNFQYPKPTFEEQKNIVEFLDVKTKEIDDMVSLEQKKIDLLKEYRQSLISEVVTGKIKVTTDE